MQIKLTRPFCSSLTPNHLCWGQNPAPTPTAAVYSPTRAPEGARPPRLRDHRAEGSHLGHFTSPRTRACTCRAGPLHGVPSPPRPLALRAPGGRSRQPGICPRGGSPSSAAPRPDPRKAPAPRGRGGLGTKAAARNSPERPFPRPSEVRAGGPRPPPDPPYSAPSRPQPALPAPRPGAPLPGAALAARQAQPHLPLLRRHQARPRPPPGGPPTRPRFPAASAAEPKSAARAAQGSASQEHVSGVAMEMGRRAAAAARPHFRGNQSRGRREVGAGTGILGDAVRLRRRPGDGEEEGLVLFFISGSVGGAGGAAPQ